MKQQPRCTWLRITGALAFALAAQPVLAEVRCVDSVPALNAAIERADEVNVEIRLVQGTYNLTNSCLDAATPCNTDDDVVIKGGYSAGCASQTLDARLTVLTRPGGGIALSTGGSAFVGNGDIEFSNLRIDATPNGVSLSTVGNPTLPDVEVRLSRVWLSQTRLRVASDEVFATHVLVADARGAAGSRSTTRKWTTSSSAIRPSPTASATDCAWGMSKTTACGW